MHECLIIQFLYFAELIGCDRGCIFPIFGIPKESTDGPVFDVANHSGGLDLSGVISRVDCFAPGHREGVVRICSTSEARPAARFAHYSNVDGEDPDG